MRAFEFLGGAFPSKERRCRSNGRSKQTAVPETASSGEDDKLH